MKVGKEQTSTSLVENASRWMAERTTRRSFLHRLGKFAVIVAGGPVLVSLLARRADAQVCGQSGVSVKCDTFDCTGPNQVWGWCWYASPGCCTDHGLKKICDCCELDFPNVHGYCPAGTNVKCVVESCYADPRVVAIAVEKISFGTNSVDAAIAMSQHRFAGGSPKVVIGNGADAAQAALANTVAGALKIPLLLTSPTSLSNGIAAEISRLRATSVVFVGPSISLAVKTAIVASATPLLTNESVGTSAALPALSIEVGRFVLGITGSRRALCISDLMTGDEVSAAAGAACAVSGMALAYGIFAAQTLANDLAATRTVVTYVAGPDVAGLASTIPGGNPVDGTTTAELARGMNAVAIVAEKALAAPVILCSTDNLTLASGLAAGGVLIFTPPGQLDLANRAFVRAVQPSLTVGLVASDTTADQVYQLQSALNHFDTHRLIGVAGEGLPVIHQPDNEKEIGSARIAGVAPVAPGNSAYWTSRANPNSSNNP